MIETLSCQVDIPDDLLKASDEQIKIIFDVVISTIVNRLFYELQERVGIKSGDEPLDSDIDVMETNLVIECTHVFQWQCKHCISVDECIINWLDENEDNPPGWDDIVNEIKDRCKLDDAKYIVMKIVRDFGYNRKDAHIPSPSTEYRMTDDLYEDLDDLCQCEDCKNGCQLMQEPDGTYYFQITGANFYDKENNYAGTDTVKVWFKEFVW